MFFLLWVSSFKELLDVGVRTLAVELDVAGLVVLDDHRHSLPCAVEFKDVEHGVVECVPLRVLDDDDIAGVAS